MKLNLDEVLVAVQKRGAVLFEMRQTEPMRHLLLLLDELEVVYLLRLADAKGADVDRLQAQVAQVRAFRGAFTTPGQAFTPAA